MPNPTRKIITTGVAIWTKPWSTVVWFEIGKGWAENLFEGNWFERHSREFLLNLMAPGFGSAMNLLIEYYRGKLKPHIGSCGIWIAVKLPNPAKPITVMMLKYIYAKKRTDSHKLKVPEPWEPAKGNIL